MSNRLRFLLLVLLTPVPWLVATPSQGTGTRHQVLILHSYNERYEWTRSISEGLSRGLEGSGWDLWWEYLDSKNLSPDFDFSAYDNLLAEKYSRRAFDLVIVVDDPAYQYFVRTRESIFHGVPAVATGLNGPPETRLPGLSYLIERPHYGKTLNLALELHPLARRIHVVLDRSVSAQKIRQAIETTPLIRPTEFDWIQAANPEEVIQRALEVTGDDLLVFAVYFDPAAGYISNNRILRRIQESVNRPIYTFWEFNVEAGATGGYLYSGEELGRQAAKAALQQVTQASVTYQDMPQGTWTFRWPQVQQFHLSVARMVPGLRYIDRPDHSWTIDSSAVFTFLAGFGILAGFTVLILVNLANQRRIVESRENLIATQKALMASLGDVIETRSEETASHVQRITRLSVRLAQLAGLKGTDLEHLEIGAPMHDIGKVGIPDAILKKPGKLTPEEQEIMKSHTVIGHSIFGSSPNPVFQAAASIALEHHEKWDGSGYPQGKSGESIDRLARIVSLVDVFDALMTERVYKHAWPPEEVRTFLEAESGRSFDPTLCRLFLDHWEEFCRLRSEQEWPSGRQRSGRSEM